MKDETKLLMRNNNFRFVIVIFLIINGSATSLATIIAFLIEPFGFNSVDTSIFGVIVALSGFISSIIFPIIIQEYQWYLKSMKMMAFGCVLSQLCILLSLASRNFNLVAIAMFLFGFFNFPVMPVVYSFATEITYPISEALFGGIL